MQTKEQSIKGYFKSLTLIHTALLLGQLIFGIAAYYLVITGIAGDTNGALHDVFLTAVPLFVIGSIGGSSFIVKSRLKTIKGKKELEEKLTDYRATLIIKFALLEGATLLALASFILTADYFLLSLAVLTIAIFFISRPARDKAINDLELKYADRALVNSIER